MDLKGYHITKKSNLYSISKMGLVPKLGRRSASVQDKSALISFTPSLKTIPIWKERLFKNESYDDLVVLVFDLTGIEHTKRYDSAGDFFTKNVISQNKIRVLQLYDKTSGEIVSLKKLEDNFYKILFDKSQNSDNIIILEEKLEKLKIQQVKLTNEQKTKVLEELATYEHEKWSKWQYLIHWHAVKGENGELLIRDDDLAKIKTGINNTFKGMNEEYKQEIRESVLETFYILRENDIVVHIADLELLSKLELIEHNRINRWAGYMLSCCEIKDGTYIIPYEKVQLWENEKQTHYNNLTEKQKDSDRKEVTLIMDAIEHCSTEAKLQDQMK
ncbi:MAG: hypothetical protein PHR96_03935 [Clostridia bacterium]|nr:hypothetical protein [Clostridia bacterium]